MPRRQVRVSLPNGEMLHEGFADVRRELGVPRAFPPEVLAEAAEAARAPRLPSYDATDVALVTIDPPGSTDLDQALHVERRGRGFRVRYAIADVGAFVRPGGAVDREAHRRGETMYCPDLRVPLHPPVLSEGAASLLAGETRPALLWILDLDEWGEGHSVEVRRALVRSRQRLDYAEAQRSLDAGTAVDSLQLLRDVGRLREEREQERGGVHLPVAEQEVVTARDAVSLAYRAPLPVEGWNAQISLMTGMAAAELMLYGEVGVLRTLPDADPRALARLRRSAAALGVPWADEEDWPDVVRRLDPQLAPHAALLDQATTLLRGAGYTAFDGGVPEQATHAAVAAEYAHVTAPLRRLVDRYAAEVCVALCAGAEVPTWVRAALPTLPAEMAAADRLGNALERAIVDLVEATVLQPHVGREYDAVVIDVDRTPRPDGTSGEVQLREPAVVARCTGDALPLGRQVRVRLEEADPLRRRVRFARV